MKIEFNTQEEYELFRRVMDAVKNQPPTPAQAVSVEGAIPFSMGQEHELMHKPEVGANRFSTSVPLSPPMSRNSGYPYGSTRFLWGVDIVSNIVDGVAYPAIKVGVGLIALISADASAVQTTVFYESAEQTLQIDMNYDVQYVRLNFMQNHPTTPITLDGPYETPAYVFENAIVFGATAAMSLYKLITPVSGSSRTIEAVIPCQKGVIELHLPILPLGASDGNQPTWSAGLTKYLG